MRRRRRRPLEGSKMIGREKVEEKEKEGEEEEDKMQQRTRQDRSSNHNSLAHRKNTSMLLSSKAPIFYILCLVVFVTFALVSSYIQVIGQAPNVVVRNNNDSSPSSTISSAETSTRKTTMTTAVGVSASKQRKRQQKVKPASAQMDEEGMEGSNNNSNNKQRGRSKSWRTSSMKAPFRQQTAEMATENYGPSSSYGGASNNFSDEQQLNTPSQEISSPAGQLQVSISARVNLVRVPVESNAILKCLISSQTNKFVRPFRIRWSRLMYDENVYEQIESSTGFEDDQQTGGPTFANSRPLWKQNSISNFSSTSRDRNKRQSEQGTPVLNRQQQLREFLERSRQETNVISDLLIEATLSISPVKASDNATYYCSASDINPQSKQQQQQQQQRQQEYSSEGGAWEQRARIDLLALSSPSVRLGSVQPNRDSKSAIVFWSILSDGNTPIKRIILMLKNESQTLVPVQQNHDSSSSSSNPFRSSGFFSNFNDSQASNKQLNNNNNSIEGHVTASVVMDQDHQQWLRIDIKGEGQPEYYFEGPSSGDLMDPRQINLNNVDSDVVRASSDADITSLAGRQNSNENSSTYFRNWSPARHRTMAKKEPGRRRGFNLTGLLPGVPYQLKVAALNDMGQSQWSQMSFTIPNEFPAQIEDVVVLSNSNDSITIGWRRPPWDKIKTIRYEMQLFDLNRTLTLDANTNTTGHLRTNYMFHFVNLQPGTDYHFHIRACGLVGCSEYSSPKLLASTLDGEADEPQDVELNCSAMMNGQQQQQQTIVSWLPPKETRGKLLNYSIQIESSAHYRNSSGRWTHEEWRQTFETNDNHTLSFELSSFNDNNQHQHNNIALMPNTNYSARVCANNRSRGCGKLSAVTLKSQCFIQGRLPNEAPADIRLSLGKLRSHVEEAAIKQRQPEEEDPLASPVQQQNGNYTTATEQKQTTETLYVDFPLISWRNGSIDCIQIVLVKLPASFDGSRLKPLSNFLPDDPAEIKLHEYVDLVAKVANQQQNSLSNDDNHLQSEGGKMTNDGNDQASKKQQQEANSIEQQLLEFKQNRAFAYLAEELDSTGQWPSTLSKRELSIGRRRIALGDGQQLNCQSVWLAAGQQDTNNNNQQLLSNTKHRPLQPLDGALMEDTYYTGFLRLVQVRRQQNESTHSKGTENETLKKRSAATGLNGELVTKYSNYFSPVKTGPKVPEVPMDLLLSQNSMMSNHQLAANQRGASSELSLCRWSWLVDFQSRAFGTTKACRFLSETTNAVHRSLLNLSRTLVSSFSPQSNNDGPGTASSLARLLQKANMTATSGDASGPVQVLLVGLVVIGLSLSLLLIIYLFTLPASVRRRRKQRKLRKQFHEHEAAAAAAASQAIAANRDKGPNESPFVQQPNDESGGFLQTKSRQQQAVVAPMLSGDILVSQHASQEHQATMEQPIECPIHVSPTVLHNSQQLKSQEDLHAMQQRRQSVHVFQSQQQQTRQNNDNSHSHDHHTLHHHHLHLHHQQQQQQQHLSQQAPSDMQRQKHQAQYQLDQCQQQQQTVMDYARNCRTMRRGDPQIAGQYSRQDFYGNLQRPPQQQQQQQSQSQSQQQQQQMTAARAAMTLQHGVGSGSLAATVLALAKKINKSIPLALFHAVLECRLRNGWLREEYEQLPRIATTQSLNASQQALDNNGNHNNNSTNHNHNNNNNNNEGGRHIKLRPQLIVSRDDSVSALISGNEIYDGSLIRMHKPSAGSEKSCGPIERQFICVKSPLDADSVWDFWRLVYEREVSTLVMLTPNEDVHTGELRCAQYWPTCDNEETTILSPCNEHVQGSNILPAKFKIRQETLSSFEDEDDNAQLQQYLQQFKVRRLTLLVMATKLSENEHILGSSSVTTNGTLLTTDTHKEQRDNIKVTENNGNKKENNENNGGANNGKGQAQTNGKAQSAGAGCAAASAASLNNNNDDAEDDEDDNDHENADDDDEEEEEEKLIIVERQVLHFQFLHWNASSSSNQAKLIKFIEFVNERHARQLQLMASPGANWQQCGSASPILVHCANGIGRSGLFAAMSFVIDDLHYKISQQQQLIRNNAAGYQQQQQHGSNTSQQQLIPKINLFQLVARLRGQRDMLLSPYRFYELLYQLTARCIPVQQQQLQQ